MHKLLTGRQDFSGLRQRRRPVRLPEPGRDRARHRRELARLHRAVLGRRHRPRLPPARAARPARRRRRRRRRAHRRHGLGGAQQHRHRRPHRSSSSSTTTSAPTRRPSAGSPTTSRPCARPAGYERFLDWGRDRRCSAAAPRAGWPTRRCTGSRRASRTSSRPQGMFEDLGMKYLGPVDGHDVAELEHALRRAKSFGGPVIVHAITQKGHGYAPAENDEADRFHAIGVIDPADRPAAGGRAADPGPTSSPTRSRRSATSARTSSASPPPCSSRSGCTGSRQRYPDRVFDVGIAEQHAVDQRGRAWRSPGCTRSSPSTRPSSTARSTRCSWTSRCTGPGSRSCSTGGVTGDDGAEPQRDVGPLAARRRPRHPGRRPAGRRHAAGRAARGGGRRRRAHRRPVPEGGPARRTARAVERTSAAWTCSPAGATRTCSSWPSARWRRSRSTSPTGSSAQGIGVTVVDPRWVLPVDRRSPRWPPGTGWSSSSRTTGGPAASASAVEQQPRGRRGADPGARLRHPPAVPRPRPARRRCSSESGLTAQDVSRTSSRPWRGSTRGSRAST